MNYKLKAWKITLNDWGYCCAIDLGEKPDLAKLPVDKGSKGKNFVRNSNSLLRIPITF